MRRLLALPLVLAGVVVAAPADADSPPGVVLTADNNGARADRLFANTHRSYEGSEIRLLRREDGAWVKIDEAIANRYGNARFTVPDLNGRGITTYKAVLHPADPEDPYGRQVGKVRVR